MTSLFETEDPRIIKAMAAFNAKAKQIAFEYALLDILYIDFKGDKKRFNEEKAEIINDFNDVWEDVRRERQRQEERE